MKSGEIDQAPLDPLAINIQEKITRMYLLLRASPMEVKVLQTLKRYLFWKKQALKYGAADVVKQLLLQDDGDHDLDKKYDSVCSFVYLYMVS